MTNCLIDIS